MSDWISREVAIGALEDRRNKYLEDGPNWLQIQMDILTIRALPAMQPDAREVALREAVNGLRKAAEDLDGYVGRGYGDEYLELADSLALPAVQPGHVNETPKSEHDARDVLTPATKGGAHD